MAKSASLDDDAGDSNYVVLSKVRSGHKREFAFALKSQSEIAAASLGRTRARRKGTEMMAKEEEVEMMMIEREEEPESDVVDIGSDDDENVRASDSIESRRRNDVDEEAGLVIGEECLETDKRIREPDVGDFVNERPTKRFNQSVLKPCLKEVEVYIGRCASEQESGGKEADNVGTLLQKLSNKRGPAKLKDLLRTGLLEGMTVRYMRNVKVKGPEKLELRGVIHGFGILCYCDKCKGTKVVSPNEYELHAGSSNKRPADYIYLENGNTLRDVLNACQDATLDEMEVTIRHASGCFSGKNYTSCVNCKGFTPQVNLAQLLPVSTSVMEISAKDPTLTPKISKCHGFVEAEVAKKSSQGTAKPRSTGGKSQKRVTRKDMRLHKLVFDDDVLPDGTEVGYYVRGKKLLSGYKRGLGIFCMCCQKEVSPSTFEAHAGCAPRKKPYLNIYTSNGVSLHELSVSLARTRNSSVDENDDLCGICFEAGELLCCDGCPRAFHAVCSSVPTVPSGKWYCQYCENMFEREKFAAYNANAIAAGRVAGVDPLEQISRRCIRVIKTLDSDSSCCVLCRGHDFSKTGFGPRTVIICDQCEREYHVGCLQSHGIQDLKELPQGKWFCSADCNRIHRALQRLVETSEQDLPDSLLDAIYKKLVDKEPEYGNLQIGWRLLSGKSASTDETRLLLSKAVSVFHERFDPILNPNSTQDLIPHMVYGRDLNDRELGGMYCAVLSVNSIVVSAVVFRVFGKEVAEVPLVATSAEFQGKGYFQSLYTCIETLLRDLGVKDMLLPAAEEARSLWTKFGYTEIQQIELNELMISYNLMMFNGTSMLRKPVPML